MWKMPHVFSYAQPHWAVPGDGYWRDAEKIAQEIVVRRKKKLVSPPAGRVHLVKLRTESGFGAEYYMTIEVTGEDDSVTSYFSKVYRLPGGLPYEIASFDKILGPDEKAASSSIKGKKRAALSDGKSSSIITRSRKSIITRSMKRAALSDGKSSSINTRSRKTSDEKASSTIKGKKRASHSTMSDVNEGSTELDSPEVTGRLRTRGFYILLEQIRSERPTLSYSKARKMASSTWRKLPEDKKMTFIGDAAKRQKP